MRVHSLISLFVVSVLPFSASAQKKAVVDANRPMSISYGSPSWNTDSAKIDSAFLVMRDSATGKIVQIQLEETEPDSSHFTGRFSVNLGQTEKVEPEIYIPPQDMRGGEKDYKKLYEAIQNKRLVRKPVIWKKNEKGQALIDVYDTREQAASALKAYQDEQNAAQDLKKKSLIKPLPSESTLAAAQAAERQTALAKLALEAAKREADRVRLEQIEKQKAEELAKQAAALSAQEKAERRAQAQKLAEEALALFNAGDFPGAEAKFKQATELDPENTSYYFKYGVALYRNNKFNDALVILKLAHVEPKLEIERKYFMGLCHYRLNEYEASLAYLREVASGGDPVMAPSALFYIGLMQLGQEKFEEAKKSFEAVIDTSSDPRMDEQAEEYLDRIASALMYKKMRENKWKLMGIIGAMYDSNVLLSADNAADQGTATNIADFRLLTIGQIDYRPVFSEHHEWALSANAGLTNSARDASAPADPWVYNVSAPYTYKGMLWGKGYRLTAKPANEILYMAVTSETKNLILNSYLLTLDNTFVMNPTWFSTYTLEYRADDSQLATSIGDDNMDASKISVRTIQMAFLDKAKKEAIMGNLGYVMNLAKGKNEKYNRIELGSTYVRPTNWNASWNFGLNAYYLTYPSASESRKDLNVTLSTGINKPVKDWVTWGVLGSFSRNNSNLDANTYSKFMILTTATFTTAF